MTTKKSVNNPENSIIEVVRGAKITKKKIKAYTHQQGISLNLLAV